MSGEGVGTGEAVRLLERVADRLRVVGPRLAGREGEEAASRLRQIRAGLQRLADLAADAEGEPRRPVPVLAAHALGDQMLVLGYEALGSSIAERDVAGPDVLEPDPPGDEPPRSAEVRAAAVQALQDVYQLM